MKLIEDKLEEEIWNKIYKKFKFNPSIKLDIIPFKFDIEVTCYTLNSLWTEEQENLVNELFKKISNEEIFALEWQSDCFEFNPNEYENITKQLYDETRNCNVYFPTYYPNGEYFFFIDKNFSYGLLGHPWRKEVYVFGDTLIKLFNENEETLNITKKDL